MSPRRSRLVPAVVALSLVGGQAACNLPALLERNAADRKMTEDARRRGEAAQANARVDRYVIADEVWLCPTAEAARAGGPCAGGHHVLHNRDVTVIGQAATDGVWRTEIWDAQGAHPLFVADAALGELPELTALDQLAADLDRRYPDARRIPVATVTLANLIEAPRSFKGRYLVLRQPSGSMTNKDFTGDRFVFTIPIAVSSTSRWSALAQFELTNRALVADFKAGDRSYRCGASYCDEFLIVATLTGRTVERLDDLGHVHRLPVFEIKELGDRFGATRGR
ncbi:MAG: hypothetical protein IPL61_05485 [Myxococcales bacterium]|nr:hypothetical protein [Myxococcales bacterium]